MIRIYFFERSAIFSTSFQFISLIFWGVTHCNIVETLNPYIYSPCIGSAQSHLCKMLLFIVDEDDDDNDYNNVIDDNNNIDNNGDDNNEDDD